MDIPLVDEVQEELVTPEWEEVLGRVPFLPLDYTPTAG
jgi:hypothetical protein